MDKQTKRQWFWICVQIVVVFSLLALGLFISWIFVLIAIFANLGFEVYRVWIKPGGSW